LDRWFDAGRLPFAMKSKNTAMIADKLFVVTGQLAVSDQDPRPGQVSDRVWTCSLKKITPRPIVD
jgi:hypothetical protein